MSDHNVTLTNTIKNFTLWKTMSKKTKNINPLHITRMPFRIMLCNNQQLSQMARKLTQWYCFGTVSNQLLLVSFYQIVIIHNKPAVWSLQRWQRISQCITHKYDSWVKSGRWGETRKETKTKDISALWFLVGLQTSGDLWISFYFV